MADWKRGEHPARWHDGRDWMVGGDWAWVSDDGGVTWDWVEVEPSPLPPSKRDEEVG